MTIIYELSSQVGDRTTAANRRVAADCLANEGLLTEIVTGLDSKDHRLVGDCAEVLTMVAQERPLAIAPFAAALVPILRLKKNRGRARWEATHALSLVAEHVPDIIAPLLPQLESLIRDDASVIVRDYATTTVANYAGLTRSAALASFGILEMALVAHEGKHAARALRGLQQVAMQAPELATLIRQIASSFLADVRPTVRKAAKTALCNLQTS
ncbi:MAG: hypothetical protein HY692_02085 [Cyanobacteria bacterium NC_groundwater_1444_Ag_S-0.65um_54_12]|nr:hypothetical protein [Cyanobacteria bacterium NC_groundwater_1444_Ag_S-0.65um_54_12]